MENILKQLRSTFPSSQVLTRPDFIKYNKYLHDRFVIVLVGKASNYFGIVCRKCYLKMINKELGVSNDETISRNNVYK